MTTATYTDPTKVDDVKSKSHPPTYGQSASGYGAKVPTRHMVKINGRWRRVYVMQYANSGSAYVVLNGVDTFLDTDTKHRLQEV